MRNAELTAPAGTGVTLTRGTVVLLAAVLGAGAVVAALDYLNSLAPSVEIAPPLDPVSLRPGFGPASFDIALADVNQKLEGKRALLAREPGADYAKRPFLPVITGWAIVLDAAGRKGEVLEVVKRAERAGFRSPTLLMFKSGALAELGRPEEAEEARKSAVAMNPKIAHPRQAYVHFRQD